MILKIISRLFFFIIVAVYFLVFMLSLDGGGRLSILNILAASGGDIPGRERRNMRLYAQEKLPD